MKSEKKSKRLGWWNKSGTSSAQLEATSGEQLDIAPLDPVSIVEEITPVMHSTDSSLQVEVKNNANLAEKERFFKGVAGEVSEQIQPSLASNLKTNTSPIVDKANQIGISPQITSFQGSLVMPTKLRPTATLYHVPRIIFTEQVYCDMVNLVGLIEANEVGWLSTVRREGFDFYVEETFVPKQTVSATLNTMADEGLASLAHDILQQEDGLEKINRLRFWGHSHVNMSVGPSTTDVQQFERLISNVDDWYIRAIVNKQGDIRLDMYICEWGIFYENLPWQYYSEAMVSSLARIQKQTVKNVKYSSSAYFRQNASSHVSSGIRPGSYSGTYANYGGE